ncbi:tetratricopeptide repeat protein [Oleiharenicola lentus]|uniref:tetratricopeptide repeat protein n=1 Tax=Oleiharenicola lentus TaxID=2508720 RepID=UPI003F676884
MLISPSKRLFSTLLLVGASLVFTASASAQAKARDYSPSETTGEAITKYKTAVDAKNYDSALAILDAQLAKVAADSYDAALLYQIKTQTFLQKGDFAKAIEPLEKGLQLSDTKTPSYYEEKLTRDLVYFQAQLYLQEAVQSKDPKVIASLYEKSDNTMARWLKLTPATTSDAQLLYSQLLYSRAVQNPEKPDLAILKRALEQVEIGLRLSTRPKDTFYVLKLVSLQQLDRNAEAVEVLELLVKQKPDSGTYWQQLAAIYLGADKPIRAALSIERAQSHGHMSTPKDHYNLVGIYFNIGQFEKAAELLTAGLKNGSIEPDIKNWELLALCYQQMDRPFKSIESLKEAAKAFPKSGQIEFLIAQAYQSLDKSEETLLHLQNAASKGNLTQPHRVYLYLAYIAFELKKFDIAMDAAKKAAAIPEGAKDGQNMIKAIEETLKDREARKSKM